ncbi:DUF6414 family protein [Amycolatopsis magusensis]|uniref:DUF6414 family protein n=1 Tax=Amycolatopsis magusensis TaxID=882444 RepID=UPI0037B2EA81
MQHQDEVEYLRDYLYLDIDKVKSIAGQLDFGVPEELRDTDTSRRRGSAGWNKVLTASMATEKGEETFVQRSLLDSLFPELEAELEDGWLVDISEHFRDGIQNFEKITELRHEGSVFRLSAPGILFNSEYFANLLSGLSAATGGFQKFINLNSQPLNSKNNTEFHKGGSSFYRSIPEHGELEDYIEEFSPDFEMSPARLKAMVRILRGVFRPGLSLLMRSGYLDNSVTLAARFQPNRRYFDAEADVIGSRFGASEQMWTIVGTIGHYSRPREEIALENLINASRGSLGGEDKFSRVKFAKSMSSLLENIGASGLADLPQYPGISAVPMAVYRTFARLRS